MIGEVLQFQDLQELCRPGERPRLPTVEAWACKEGIRYRYDGKSGIWTTAPAMNAALGLQQASTTPMETTSSDGTSTEKAQSIDPPTH